MIDLQEYKGKLEKLENYLDFAIDVTNVSGGQQHVPWKLVRANQLFIRMTMTCSSIVRLLPFNRIFSTKGEFWDLHSVLSLARNLIENYLMFWYVSVEEIEEAESKFRHQILNYHLNSEKYKFYEESGADHKLLEEFITGLAESKIKIEANPLFNSLVLDPHLFLEVRILDLLTRFRALHTCARFGLTTFGSWK